MLKVSSQRSATWHMDTGEWDILSMHSSTSFHWLWQNFTSYDISAHHEVLSCIPHYFFPSVNRGQRHSIPSFLCLFVHRLLPYSHNTYNLLRSLKFVSVLQSIFLSPTKDSGFFQTSHVSHRQNNSMSFVALVFRAQAALSCQEAMYVTKKKPLFTVSLGHKCSSIWKAQWI